MSTLLTLLVLGALTIGSVWLLATLVTALLSGVLGLASFLLFTVAPAVLIGWLAWKFVERARRPRLSAADRRWLERGE